MVAVNLNGDSNDGLAEVFALEMLQRLLSEAISDGDAPAATAAPAPIMIVPAPRLRFAIARGLEKKTRIFAAPVQ